MSAATLPNCPLCCSESETYPEPGYLSCLSCHFIAPADEWRRLAEQAAKARAWSAVNDRLERDFREEIADVVLAEERKKGGLT